VAPKAQTHSPQRRYKPAETRALILAAARDLFHAQGYSQTSSLEIAQRAGVAEGSLFYHFGSKKNLLAALGEEYARGSIEVMRGGTEDLSELEPGIIIARAFDHARTHGVVMSRTGLPIESPEIQPFLHANRKVVVAFIAECIRASNDQCTHEPPSADVADVSASFSYAVVSDAIFRVFESETPADEEMVLRETIRYVRAACGYGHLTDIPSLSPAPKKAEIT
jgi:AcrR family transcriptional regulator